MARHPLVAPRSDLVLRTRWYVYIRWFVLIAIGAPFIVAETYSGGWSLIVQRDILLLALALASNGVFYFLVRTHRSPRYYRVLATALLIFDIFLITCLIYLKGGVESRGPVLYTLPILMSSAIVGRAAIYRKASISALLYSALVIADYHNVISTVGGSNPTLRHDFSYVFSSIAFYGVALIMVGTITDFITRQLLDKEQQALESAEALKRAQAIAGLGSWQWDVEKGIIKLSEQLYRIFGLAPSVAPFSYQEFINKIHPDERSAINKQIKNSLKAKKPFRFEHKVKWPDGSIRYVRGEAQVQIDKKGEVIKVYGTAQDITSERSLDQAKNEFVSLASHQLRTPATGVKAFLGLLADGYAGELNDKQRQFLESAYDANERQLAIINDLLSVASVESGRITLKKTVVDLVSLTQQVIQEHASNAHRHNQIITLKKPSLTIEALVDPSRFKMILDNLISNACKYSPEHSEVKISFAQQDDSYLISIRDQGAGIAKKDMHKLFGKFSRIDDARSLNVDGSGLGLYLAKYLAELHDGDIIVKSRPGHGSTFTISVPATSEKPTHESIGLNHKVRKMLSRKI